MLRIDDLANPHPREWPGVRYNRRGDRRFKVLAEHDLVCRVEGTRSECWRVTELGRAVAWCSHRMLLQPKHERVAALARRTMAVIPGLSYEHFMQAPEFARMRERA